ncbi:MAG: hypothetical protein MJE77_15775 [Proteobacteria bacterium]|nr:hypothetical protein [Pseudomonadota bacterium]
MPGLQYRLPLRSWAWGVVAVALAASCEDTVRPQLVLTLDRPSAISFAQVGIYDEEGVRTGVNTYGLILQKAQGTVAVSWHDGDILPEPILLDTDRFTPGTNPIPVGSLPADIATDPSSCYVATANAGTCDLSLIEVSSVVDRSLRPSVRRIDLVDASGVAIPARPTAMASAPIDGPGETEFECPADPQSWLLYIAYPDCNAVAAVDAATGQAVAAVQFADDGTLTITDGTLACAGTGACGSFVAGAEQNAPRPSVVEMRVEQAGEDTSRRLYIGFDNRSAITAVDLDSEYRPEASNFTVSLEGDIGITALAVSDQLTLAGGNEFRFAYAIATDGTVRVADVNAIKAECETQGDSRYLHDETDQAFLPCMTRVDPRTPPRRAGARSPGIHIPGNALAMDVAFAHIGGSVGDLSPTTLIGDFAYIPISTGQILVVNVYDRNYAAARGFVELDSDDYYPEITLSLPHQIRDNGVDRNRLWGFNAPKPEENPDPREDQACNSPDPNTTAETLYGPRGVLLEEPPPSGNAASDNVASDKEYLLPHLRSVWCKADGDAIDPVATPDDFLPVSELSIGADTSTRKQAFPDWPSVLDEDTWTIEWEGAVVTGRIGAASFVGGFAIEDGSEPFCGIGVELHDVLVFLGCNPALGSADCALGESCFVDPEAAEPTGLCLPDDRVDQLANECRGILTTRRRFSVKEVFSDRLVLQERRRVLRTTPLEGCTGDAQCDTLYAVERALAEPEPEPSNFKPTWLCEPDPSRAGDVPRCVMTCTTDNDCETDLGFACSGGYCVEGAVPPPQCLPSLRRYAVRSSDAFVVTSQRTGYTHNRIVATDGSKQCLDDPDGHPLSIGRIPLTAVPCTGDGIEDIEPNPCLVTVEDAEKGRDCRKPLEERQAQAIRFRNSALTLHLVDPVVRTAASQECDVKVKVNQDGNDEDVSIAGIPIVYPEYVQKFVVQGGPRPMREAMLATGGFGERRQMAFPVGITFGPDGRLWVLDQGDRLTVIAGQVVLINGQVIRFSPDNLRESAFYLQ